MDGNAGDRQPTFIQWLPVIQRGPERWWLPCSTSVTVLLSNVLLSQTTNDTLAKDLYRQVVDAIRSDPPLFLYCLLNVADSEFGEDPVTVESLSQWLQSSLTDQLIKGDSFLGTPPVSNSLLNEWSRLRGFFRTLPIKKWGSNGQLWLETTGPKVPAKWRKNWVTIEDSENPENLDLETSELPSDRHSETALLQKLANQIQESKQISLCFDSQLHLNKLASLKQLAYGLSHEINNPLANISTRAQQLQRTEQDADRSAVLQRISDQVYRAHEMISDLMFFANPPSVRIEWMELNSLIQHVLDRYHSEAKTKSIEIKKVFGVDFGKTFSDNSNPSIQKSSTDSIRICADREMLGEAIGSLIRNAIEAVGDHGTVQISCRQDENHVLIEVADSGPGLSELARQHAFDPFFSGREAGRGLGVGLCRVARIAELHHGNAAISGGPAGCIAQITLPFLTPAGDVK